MTATGKEEKGENEERRRTTMLRPPEKDPLKAPIENVVDVTELSALGPDIFTNTYPPWLPPGGRGILGCTIIGQSLAAAQETVPESFLPHSCHCHFLLAGQATVPILYHVERVRDGRSFVTRTVQARQKGRCISTMTVSFAGGGDASQGGKERAQVRHAATLPGGLSPPPPHDKEGNESKATDGRGPLEVKPLAKHGMQGPLDGRRCRQWVRCRGTISPPGGQRAHLSALAYLSDTDFMETIGWIHGFWPWAFAPESVASMPDGMQAALRQRLEAEGAGVPGSRAEDWFGRPRVGMMVSLDHTIYFHEPGRVRADEWMFVETESPWTGDGRGFLMMRVFAGDGTLLASCIQEGVVRLHEAKL